MVTFREAAEAYIRDREATRKNAKHVQQWRNTMKTYAYPVIGHMQVRDINTEMIVRILQPIWMKKAETARRIHGRIKAILDAEAVLGVVSLAGAWMAKMNLAAAVTTARRRPCAVHKAAGGSIRGMRTCLNG